VEWAGGPSPPPCGQLTRCFSAVAELLVLHVEYLFGTLKRIFVKDCALLMAEVSFL